MSDTLQIMEPKHEDSRRFLTAILIAVLLHILLFAALAIVRLAEQPLTPPPVTVELAPGALGAGAGLLPGPPSQPGVQAQGSRTAGPAATQPRSGSEQGFVIPTPRAQTSETPGPRGPAFREVGTSGAQAGSAQEATSPVQVPVFPHTPATQQGTAPTSGGGGASGGPARGVLVEGGGPAPVQGSLNLNSLNEAAASAQGTGAQPPGEGGGNGGAAGAAAGSGSGGQGSYRFQWDQPAAAQARKLLYAPKPRIPAWVGKEGLNLTVMVTFTLTPDGLLTDVNIEASSGYNEVDAAVSEAVRMWRFSPAPSARPIHGLIPYAIRAR